MNLQNLNKEQLKAATHTEGPLLILAGAGSGKTATMTQRIAYLIHNGVSPYEILAVTFTNKAANEMRERVEKLVGTVPGMWILTFHAMSLRILRKHCGVAGYESNFVVYDSVDQKTLIKNILKEQNIDTKVYPQPYISAVISRLKESDTDPETYKEIEGHNPKSKVIYNVYSTYQMELKKNNAMDFDDLLVNGYHVLKDNPQILAEYQNRFKYIMVDEYQDTNHLQYKIISLMANKHKNLCVVGDDDQCIYQWRGADIRNILDFEKDFPSVTVIRLEQNYRSCGNILAAAHSVIKNNRERKPKELWTEKEPGEKIVYRRCDSDKEEAFYIAQEIALLKAIYSSYDDFAVLYRTNAQARLFEDALKRRKIPYQILSGFSFYDRKETKDMISYMRLVVNPADDLALKRIINEPKRGMGPTTVAKLDALARVNNVPILTLLEDEEVISSLPGKASAQVKDVVQVITLCRQEEENLRISDIYDNLLVKTGYMKALEEENTVEAEGRIENLMDFKSFIYDFEEEKSKTGEKATLADFLEKVSTDSDADKYDETAGKVTLMTMHSAKGLEFPVVFLPGMEDGLFPSYRSLDKEEALEEERRLCYVGMTRAKERLILTGASYRVLYGHGDYTRESTFLRELDKSLLDEMGDSVFTPSRRTENRVGVYTGSGDGFAEPAFKPFAVDPLKYAALQSKKTAMGSADIKVGERVSHPKFGEGLVIDEDEKTLTIIFDSAGQKKMARGIAPLKKI